MPIIEQSPILVLEAKGETYFAEWFEVGWWIWRADGAFDDPVYFVTVNDQGKPKRCTCPVCTMSVHKRCKHLAALATHRAPGFTGPAKPTKRTHGGRR